MYSQVSIIKFKYRIRYFKCLLLTEHINSERHVAQTLPVQQVILNSFSL